MITRLTASDLDECVTLYVETFGAPPWNETWHVADAVQRLGDFLATPRAHGVCARDTDGRLLGFALGHLERSDGADHFLLQEMCVRGDDQRRGVGTSILDALHDELRDVRQWSLLTAQDSAASAFYERNGFRPARRIGLFVRP